MPAPRSASRPPADPAPSPGGSRSSEQVARLRRRGADLRCGARLAPGSVWRSVQLWVSPRAARLESPAQHFVHPASRLPRPHTVFSPHFKGWKDGVTGLISFLPPPCVCPRSCPGTAAQAVTRSCPFLRAGLRLCFEWAAPQPSFLQPGPGSVPACAALLRWLGRESCENDPKGLRSR